MRNLTFFVLVISAAFVTSAQTDSRPNFLFIVVDDLNDFQNYLLDGHPQAETPNLNRLARSGVVFQSAYCTTPRSCPSRTSFMSGKDPDYTGVYDNDGIEPVFRDNFRFLARDTVVYTLPEVLRDSGYYTVGINKVYFGWKNEGFDNDFDSLQPDPCLRKLSWSDFIAFPPDRRLLDYEDEGLPGFIWASVTDSIEPFMFDQLAADTAIHILQTYQADPAAYCNRPLFLTLGIFLPHKPLVLPRRYFRPDYLNPDDFYDIPYNKPYNDPVQLWPPNGVVMPPQPDPMWADFDGLPPFGQDLASNGSQHETFIEWPESLPVKPTVDPDLTEEERDFILQESKRADAVIAYLAAVRYADAQIGRVMETLDSLDMASNTIVIMISDHGYSLGEKKHWHKFGLWETDNRIPMIIRHPDKASGGNVLSPVSTLDVFPTILDLANIDPPRFPDGRPYLDGFSLTPFLDAPSLMWNRAALTSLQKSSSRTQCYIQNSVRDEQFQYIKHRGLGSPGGDYCDTALSVVQEELYLLGQQRDRDKNEWENLADDPRYAPVKQYLSQWIADSSLFNTIPPRIEIVHGELPCSFTLEDTLAICFLLTDADGTSLTSLPPNTTVRYYTSFKPEEKFYGNVFQFPMNDLLNLSNYNSNRQLIVFVELVNMEEGIVLAQDHIFINANPALNPEVSFGATTHGNTLFITDPIYTESYRILRYAWDFGDGVTSTEINPVQHSYTMPGTYQVTATITYGNDPLSLCEQSFSQTISLNSTEFDNTDCLAPNKVYTTSVLCDGANLAWNPVYGALQYQLRYRKQTGADTVFQYIVVTADTLTLSALEANRDYEVQVRTYCDTAIGLTAQSEWSYPFWFATSQCFPPRGVNVTDIGMHSAKVSWIPNPGADQGYEIIYRKLGYASATRSTTDAFIVLNDLDSASLYQVQVLSQCSSGDSDINEWGEPAAVHAFITDSSSLRNTQPGYHQLLVYPNPANGFFQLSWESNQSGSATITIHNLLGRTLEQRAVREETGENNMFWSASGLSPGIYLVSLTGAFPTLSALLQITR